MTRRTALVAATAAFTVLPVVPPAHADLEFPRASCAKRVNDDAGDAHVNFSPVAGNPVAPQDSVPAVDITSMTLRVTPDAVQTFLKIDHLVAATAMQPYESEYHYDVKFKANEHTIEYGAAVKNATLPPLLHPSTSGTYPIARAGRGGNDLLDGTVTTIDTASGYISWTTPRATFEAKIGAPLVEVEKFLAPSAATVVAEGPAEFPADSAAGKDATVDWTVGDDYCFGPPPASLTDIETAPVQYRDVTEIGVGLTDESQAPLSGQQVQFTIEGDPTTYTATTDDEGVAVLAYTALAKAGKHAVTASFPGTAEIGKAKAVGELTVTAEKTAIGPFSIARSSTTRTVTATLLDDDKHAVAGQKVDWYVSGKKVATVTTDSRGKAVYRAKAGQTVQAKYAGLTGQYLAASSASVKLA